MVESAPTSSDALADDWLDWLATLFPEYISDSLGNLIKLGSHHEEFWDWVWSVQPALRPRPFVAIWPRGGGKSTSAELACVAIAARGARRYALYISATQDQADDHVQNVASMLESDVVASIYPDLAERLVGKYGNSRGWRRNRLRTRAGFTLDALGLDSAARGMKLEADRPDLMVFDDLDGELDTTETVEKKIKTITRKLLPAGAGNLAALAVQNLVHESSIFSKLADGSADFLADRIISGPHPAIVDLEYQQQDGGRWLLTDGVPLWAGQNLARCQEIVDDVGLRAFLAECQHEVSNESGNLFEREWWGRYNPTLLKHQGLKAEIIVVDAANKDGVANDFTAISVWGRLRGLIYVLACTNERLKYPELRQAVRDIYEKYRCPILVEDKGNGISLIQDLSARHRTRHHDVYPALPIIPYDPGRASKTARATTVSGDVQAGLVHLPFDESWVEDWIEQHAQFPSGRFDDMVDTTSIALAWYRNTGDDAESDPVSILYAQPLVVGR